MIKKSRSAFVITASAVALILILIIMGLIGYRTGISILAAAGCALLNFLLFLLGYSFSIQKSNKIFLLFTIGGIGVRLLIMLVLVILSIKILKIELFDFIFTLFIWYTFFLVYEIKIVGSRIETRKGKN